MLDHCPPLSHTVQNGWKTLPLSQISWPWVTDGSVLPNVPYSFRQQEAWIHISQVTSAHRGWEKNLSFPNGSEAPFLLHCILQYWLSFRTCIKLTPVYDFTVPYCNFSISVILWVFPCMEIHMDSIFFLLTVKVIFLLLLWILIFFPSESLFCKFYLIWDSLPKNFIAWKLQSRVYQN